MGRKCNRLVLWAVINQSYAQEILALIDSRLVDERKEAYFALLYVVMMIG